MRWKAWKTMPTFRPRNRASPSSSRVPRSWPATVTCPSLGRSRPPTIISRVVLPAPDGPTTLTVSPAARSRSMPRRTSTAPAAPVSVTLRLRSDTMAGLEGVGGHGERFLKSGIRYGDPKWCRTSERCRNSADSLKEGYCAGLRWRARMVSRAWRVFPRVRYGDPQRSRTSERCRHSADSLERGIAEMGCCIQCDFRFTSQPYVKAPFFLVHNVTCRQSAGNLRISIAAGSTDTMISRHSAGIQG